MSRPSDPPQDWALDDLQWIAARLQRQAAVRRADLFLTAERLERVASARGASERPRRHRIEGRVAGTIVVCAAFVGAASAAIGCFFLMPAVAAVVFVSLAVAGVLRLGWRHRHLTRVGAAAAVGMLFGVVVALLS